MYYGSCALLVFLCCYIGLVFLLIYAALLSLKQLTETADYSAFRIGKMMAVVEEFLNMHISANMGVTVLMFLIVYGGYFMVTYLSCKHMVMEKQTGAPEI